jgi:hypothetical protein
MIGHSPMDAIAYKCPVDALTITGKAFFKEAVVP